MYVCIVKQGKKCRHRTRSRSVFNPGALCNPRATPKIPGGRRALTDVGAPTLTHPHSTVQRMGSSRITVKMYKHADYARSHEHTLLSPRGPSSRRAIRSFPPLPSPVSGRRAKLVFCTKRSTHLELTVITDPPRSDHHPLTPTVPSLCMHPAVFRPTPPVAGSSSGHH